MGYFDRKSRRAFLKRSAVAVLLAALLINGSIAYADESEAEELGFFTLVPMILDAQNMAYAQGIPYGHASALNARGAMQNYGGGITGGSSSGVGSGAMAAIILGAAGAAVIGTLAYYGVKTKRANNRAKKEAGVWQQQFLEDRDVDKARRQLMNEQVAAASESADMEAVAFEKAKFNDDTVTVAKAMPTRVTTSDLADDLGIGLASKNSSLPQSAGRHF